MMRQADDVGAAGGWCVVFNCRMLPLELAAGVSGMAHDLQVEGVDLEGVAG